MRKILFLIIILFFMNSFFALSFPIEKDLYLFGFPSWQTVEKHGDIVYIKRATQQNQADNNFLSYYDVIDIKSLHLDSDGWYRSSLFGHKTNFIIGGDYFLIHDTENKDYSFFVDSDFSAKETTDKPHGFYYPESLDSISKEYDGPVIFNNGDSIKEIKKIILPDILTEKLNGTDVIYDSTSMEHYYYRGVDELLLINKNAIPWATSKNPVGMKIQISFYRPQEKITILNGYVNNEKSYLYKANRRLKRICIRSVEKSSNFSLTVDFEDSVHFEEIKLPEAAKEVEIEIIDFYEGLKYKDLCVQLIGTPLNLNWNDYMIKNNRSIFSEFKKLQRWNGQNMIPCKLYN